MSGDDIKLMGVTMHYDRADTPAVRGVDISIGPGEFVCLLGPSGCGKSTTLHVIAGFLRPTDGVVTINGRRVRGPDKRVGVVFQDHSLFFWRTVAGNASFGLECGDLDKVARRARVDEILTRTGLSGLARRYPWQLSGGERQRLAIARALAPSPSTLLLDEPFRSLDALTRETLNQLLVHLWARDEQTVLFITHDLDEALRLADRILIMTARPGRVIADVPVSFPRPRSTDLPFSLEFAEAKRALAALLQPSGSFGLGANETSHPSG